MSHISFLNSPFLLGFEEVERMLERVAKGSGDSYPPYNIERISDKDGEESILRIVLAVAGFRKSELDVSVEDRQLVIRGRQTDDKQKVYLHRGIAARQFQRTFVLADGIEIKGADLQNGLLMIDLKRPKPEQIIRKVEIIEHD